MPREAEWESRWWSPIINAEHLAMRDRVGIVDLSAFAIFDITGPGALDHVQRMAVAQMDVPVGRVVYTPLLNEAGGIKSDLTIMRLGRDHFRVVTGGAHGMGDRKWFRDHLPADGSAQLFDATSTLTTLGIWGPRARDVLAATTSDDVSNEGFPFGTARTIEVGGIPVLASRISYVGELGWELYVPMEQGARLWDTLWEAGQPYGIIPFGIGVYGTTGRLEKGYRAHGAELELEWDLVEADMLRPKVKEADFIGREAYLEQRSRPPVATLCTLTVDDNTSSSGVKRYMLGTRADPDPRRRADHRRQGPALVRDERRVRAVGRQAHPAVVPAARVREGRHEAPRRVLRRALPGDGRRRRLDAVVRPGERAGPGLTMNVLVCVKRVPATAGKITLTADEQAIDTRYLGFTVSPHEECAVEEAVRIVEAHGGSSTVLTLGPEEATDQLREAMAVGIDRAILLQTDGGEWGAVATAAAIVDAIRAREAVDGPFDLILLGNEAADTGDYQVGVRVAVALDRPVVSGAKGLEVRDDTVVARREAPGGGWEVYEIPRPAVVTVKEGHQPAALSVGPGSAPRSEEGDRDRRARSGGRRAGSHPPARAGREGECRRDPGRGSGGRTARRRGAPAPWADRMILVVVEHEAGTVDRLSSEALTLGRSLAEATGGPLQAVVWGPGAAAAAGVARGRRRRGRPRDRGPAPDGLRPRGARKGAGPADRTRRPGRRHRHRQRARRGGPGPRGCPARRPAGGERHRGPPRRTVAGHPPALGRQPAGGGSARRPGPAADRRAPRVRAASPPPRPAHPRPSRRSPRT